MHAARTSRRIVAIRALDQRDVFVELPGLVERVLELRDGAQGGCFGHSEADAALMQGVRKGYTCLPLDGMVMGVGGDYEPEAEGVGARLTTTALPMPVFPDDWMKRAPVAVEVGGRMLGMMTRLESSVGE